LQGDITNKTKLLSYPQVGAEDKDVNGLIKDTKILKIIENHQSFVSKFNSNLNFYIGKNECIKQKIDDNAPDNEINIPYARTLTHTVKGYMYKPGNITYSLEDDLNQEYFDNLMEIFKANKEPLKNSELGENQSKYGIAFEILYTKLNGDMAIPYFEIVNPQEAIPIFDYTIEKNLVACIRYYNVENDSDPKAKEKITYKVEVYYPSTIFNYVIKEVKNVRGEALTTLEFTDQSENFFKDIPINMYLNNQEYMADYEPIQGLLQLLDKLMSGSANEFDKFASAYLIMKNYVLGGNEEEAGSKLERLKKLRVFEIGEDGDIKFLVKDIPVAFFQEIKNTIKEDIQRHSFIPDFMDQSFGTASGIAIRYKLIGLENLCSDKEALFREGLERRLNLINNFLKVQNDKADISKIEIKFFRNLPEALTDEINNFKIIDPDGGRLSKATALSILSFIKNPQQEMDDIQAEKDKAQEQFNVDNAIPDLNIPSTESQINQNSTDILNQSSTLVKAST
jgi:SPP1 family phage portal protein